MTDATEFPPGNAREKLWVAAQLRAPLRVGSRDERHDAYEEFLLQTAFHQAELAQELLAAHDAKVILDDEWEDMTGWERHRAGKTDASVDRAKAQANPKLAKARVKAAWLIARLTEQIDRLEGDASKVSRAYAIMSRT